MSTLGSHSAAFGGDVLPPDNSPVEDWEQVLTELEQGAEVAEAGLEASPWDQIQAWQRRIQQWVATRWFPPGHHSQNKEVDGSVLDSAIALLPPAREMPLALEAVPQEPVCDNDTAIADALAQVVADLENWQATTHYGEARGALQTLVQRLKLSPREAAGLETEVQQLTSLVDKLEQTVIQIAVMGLVGRGKSSVLNALAGQPLFATGPTHGVTQTVQAAPWLVPAGESSELAPTDVPLALGRVALPGIGQSRIELIDTPGLDEVNGEARAQLTQQVAATADLILFVVAGDITRVEAEALETLRQANKPILVVFNKVDQYPAVDRDRLYAALVNDRLRDLISPDEIVLTAAAPLVAVREGGERGQRLVIQRGEPQVEALRLKILDILQREGLALVALNTLLYADKLSGAIVQRKLHLRAQAANEVIWNCVMTKAIAVALNPVTVLDLLTGAIVDVAMIVALANLYGLPMTHAAAVNLLKTIALELGGLSVSELLVTLGLSSLKGLLGASIPATGGLAIAPYTTVAMTQAAVVGIATYGIGQVTKQYLANGAQWGPEGAKTLVQSILESLDETSLLHRIKADLAVKLRP